MPKNTKQNQEVTLSEKEITTDEVKEEVSKEVTQEPEKEKTPKKGTKKDEVKVEELVEDTTTESTETNVLDILDATDDENLEYNFDDHFVPSNSFRVLVSFILFLLGIGLGIALGLGLAKL